MKLIGEAEGIPYFTFDDDNLRASAQADPVGFVLDLPERAVIDEVQRVPELFTSLKASIDNKRSPGRFILTGSANVLLIPRLADSLAGRMEILRLFPLSQSEIRGAKSEFLTSLFKGNMGNMGTFEHKGSERLGKELAERIVAGGFPAALLRQSARRRATWYRDYMETLIQRDIRDLARISSLHVLPRLLAAVSGQTAGLINISELAAPFQISRPTIREYVTLLTRIFLVEELNPWHSNRLKRLVKTPKLHMGDTGLACALLGVSGDSLWDDRALFGRMLETFVFQELRRQASWYDHHVEFSHFRDKDKVEVDIILEAEGKIAGIEVKASSTVKMEDFKGLVKVRDCVQKKFAAGVVFYDGNTVVPFGDRLWGVPVSTL